MKAGGDGVGKLAAAMRSLRGSKVELSSDMNRDVTFRLNVCLT